MKRAPFHPLELQRESEAKERAAQHEHRPEGAQAIHEASQ